MDVFLTAAGRNRTIRSTFGHLVSEHASEHEQAAEDVIGGDTELLHSDGMDTTFFFLIIPNIWAIISNIIVIVTIFRTATILRSFAYVMISLSAVDLCSSLFVIPFSIYFFANNMHWGLGYPLCVLWTAADVTFCTASICHHCSIALHRYLIISNPHDFSVTNNHKIIYRLIVPAWCVSAFIAIILVVRSTVDRDLVYNDEQGTCGINDRSYAIYSSIVSFFIPLSIIVVVSLRSIFILQERIDFKRRSHFNSVRHHSAAPELFHLNDRRKTLAKIVHPRRRRTRRGSSRKLDEDDAPNRIIFPSKPRIVVRMGKKMSSVHKDQRSIYRALESLTTKALSLTPNDEVKLVSNGNSVSFNGFVMGLGSRLSRNSSMISAFTRPSQVSQRMTSSRSSEVTRMSSRELAAPVNSPVSSPQHDVLKMRSNIGDEINDSAEQRGQPVTTIAKGSEEMSRVTEEIIDELSCSCSKSQTSSSLKKLLETKSSIQVFSTLSSPDGPVTSSTIISLPDIDSSSERGSIIMRIDSGIPVGITKLTKLDVSELPSIEPPPPPPETLSRACSKINKRRAPIIHMSSLEQFEPSSVGASPQSATKIHMSFKRTRRVFSQHTPSTVSNPKPIPKRLTKRASGISIGPIPPDQSSRGITEPESESETKPRRHSLGYCNCQANGGPAMIGGPLVPQKFLEMVRKRDYEREVAWVKRGRTKASFREHVSLTTQVNQRILSIKNAFRSNKNVGDKDIAMQTLARRIKKEKKAGHALLVVLTCFVLMWAPFFTLNITYGICEDCVSKALFTLFSWIAWASCGVNPIIYTLCSRQFRQGLFRSLADIFGRMHARNESLTRSLRSLRRSR